MVYQSVFSKIRFHTIARVAPGLAGIFVLFFCVAVRAIVAQGGPPMITDDTETVPKGHFEINTAVTFERGADGDVYGAPLLDFNYGLGEHLQLKVEIPWVVFHRPGGKTIGGLGNTNVGMRWRFRDETEHHRVAISIYPQFEFNNPGASVRRGLVERGPSFLMPLQWQTKLGKYGVNGDVGYRLKRGADEVIYGVLVGREFKHFELLAEVHGTGPARAPGQSEVVYNFGSRVPLTKHTTLLLSGGRSLRNHFDPRFIGYAGIQVTF
jgi:hypothetical protein